MSKHSYGMFMARSAALTGTCNRRQIGAALFKGDICFAVGNNGPLNLKCECPGRDTPAGSGSAICYGMHAEQRALTAPRAPGFTDFDTIYCTKAPCKACVLLLLGTSCEEIVFETPSNEVENMELWIAAGRTWTHYGSQE